MEKNKGATGLDPVGVWGVSPATSFVSLIGGIGLATPRDADSRAGTTIALGDPFIYRKGVRLLGPDVDINP